MKHASLKIAKTPKRSKGGPGSGNFGHAGRPGEVGGSAPDKFSAGKPATAADLAVRYNEADQYIMENAQLYWDQMDSSYGQPLTHSGLTDHDLRVEVKRGLCEAISQEAHLPYDMVVDVTHQWAETSNKDYRSLSLQEAASEELGMPLSKWQQQQIAPFKEANAKWEKTFAMKAELDALMKKTRREIGEWGNVLDETAKRWNDAHPDGPSFRQVYNVKLEPPVKALTSRENERAIIRAMYNLTQEQLKDLPDEVVLFRGVKGSAAVAVAGKQGDTVRYTGNAMESWSADRSVAVAFADSEGAGAVIAMRVPKVNIISTAITGFGCLNELEYVVTTSTPSQATIWQYYK